VAATWNRTAECSRDAAQGFSDPAVDSRHVRARRLETVLSPPDHRMVDLVVDYTSTDDCGTPTCTLSVTSNEPGDGLGDGDTPVDFEVIDNHHVRLRAERSALGLGRTYTIAVSCSGIDGLSTSRTTSVFVPRDAR
jgi:hypothetical protein